ncbi:hypothetical protein [Lactococcus garvieae]|nr:hypothetical protein [Lactococcus garvieae]QPS72004.1 hypothetical protein I6G50_04885 [Lactococcus garvieae]
MNKNILDGIADHLHIKGLNPLLTLIIWEMILLGSMSLLIMLILSLV